MSKIKARQLGGGDSMLEFIKLEELHVAIARTGKTQQQLAEDSGVGQSHISKLLRGKRGISLVTFARLCQAIGREPAEFLTDEGKSLLTYD